MTALQVTFPRFRARPPWFGGDLQTVRNAVLREWTKLEAWPGRRLYAETPDGDRLSGMLHKTGESNGRLVVLIHGLTGCEDSAYVRASARHFLENGFDVFRANLRGAGPSRADCWRMYHAGRSADLALWLSILDGEGFGTAGRFAVGYSLGANILLKYLAEAGGDARVDQAVAVSAPLDLAAASTRLEANRNRGYHRWLLRRMKADWHAGPLEISPEQAAVLEVAETIREFDNGVVAPMNGFRDAADYYASCASGPLLDRIAVPTLAIHADNDPWIPADAHRALGQELPMVNILLSHGGGHVGFHGKGGRWHDRCAMAFFNAAS